MFLHPADTLRHHRQATQAPDGVHRRPDGSIDTGHYMARARRMRSEAARGLLGR